MSRGYHAIRTRDVPQGMNEQRRVDHANPRENALNGVFLARVVQNSDEQYLSLIHI